MRSLRWLIPALAVVALASAPAADAQRPQPRIIAGSDVDIATYPFQVSLRQSGSFICGGSIRDATHVITAAHCVTTGTIPPLVLPASQFSVGYGSASLGSQATVGVSTVAVPSQYTAALNPDESYDVAVLTLSSPIDLSGPNAKAIAVAGPAQPKDAGTGVVTGWGDTTENGSGSNTLQGTSVPLQPDGECTRVYGSAYVATRAVCAGGGSLAANNPDTCQGDSGGPLAVDLDPGAATNFVLLGVTSFGDGCGRQATPGVYTWTQGTGVAGFLGAPTDPSTPGPSTAPQPAPVAPPPAAAVRDTTRPTARLSKLSCTKRRRCTFRIAASDTGGRVAKLSATVSRKVRTCRRRGSSRSCRTTTRRKRLKATRASGGFTLAATLAKSRYTFEAVATDASGNRSRALRRAFVVR